MRSAHWAFLAITWLASSSGSAQYIISGDGTESCRIPPLTVVAGPNCTAKPVSVDPRWQPNDPNGLGARWISFADTGFLGTTLAVPQPQDPPARDHQSTVMQLREDFVAAPNTALILNVWADDTANVQIRYDDPICGFTRCSYPPNLPPGTSLQELEITRLSASNIAPSFIPDGGGGADLPACPNGQPGCSPIGKAGTVYFFEEAAPYSLLFNVFQSTEGDTSLENPFGLLYSAHFALSVDIDIKPSKKRNNINPSSKGKIWVVVLSHTDSGFDPLQTKIRSARLGPGKARAVRHRVKDINGDGVPDLLLLFNVPDVEIDCDDTDIFLTGETFAKEHLIGKDLVRPTGCNRN